MDASIQIPKFLKRYLLAVLISVELLMSFSFLGYFHVEPISVTIAYIPVLVAGALLDAKSATAVGLAFGLASMWKATASYVMPSDQLFSPLLSGNPLGSLLLSVGSRMLFGLAIGVLYMIAKRLRPSVLWVGIVSYLGSTVHSFFVYSAMYLFFPETGYTPLRAFTSLLSPSNILADGIIAAGVVLIWWGAHSKTWMQIQHRLTLAQGTQSSIRYHRLSLAVVAVLSLIASFAVTFYFVQRINYVLEEKGINLSNTEFMDVLHLQIQFLFGILSLTSLLILFLIVNRQYNSYRIYESKVDSLTGALTRRAFFSSCGQALASMERKDKPCGYFLMVDLDNFKDINDRYGHPEGDRALREVSRILKEIFENCLLGRLGGDEFAVLITEDISQIEMEVLLSHFREQVCKISWEEQSLTCSIGALLIQSAQTPEELYRDADQLLYAAKEQGRDRYVIGHAASTATAEHR